MIMIGRCLRMFLLLMFGLTLSACSKNIEGRVSDVFGKGVPGVKVKIDKSNFTTTTDAAGNYHLDYAPGSFIVTFSKPGYTTMKLDLNIQQKSKFPAEEVVVYPIPEERGIYAIGQNGLTKLSMDNTVLQYSRQTGPYFSFTKNFEYRVAGNPEVNLPPGKLRLIDTYPGTTRLASCKDGVVLSSDISLYGRNDLYNGFIEGKEETIGEEKLLVRTFDIPPGAYALTEVQNAMVMGMTPKESGRACAFLVGPAGNLAKAVTETKVSTKEKMSGVTLKGQVTKNESGNHAGFITVNDGHDSKTLFWSDSSLILVGEFPAVGDNVTVQYKETASKDTPLVITKLVNQ